MSRRRFNRCPDCGQLRRFVFGYGYCHAPEAGKRCTERYLQKMKRREGEHAEALWLDALKEKRKVN